MDTSVSEAIRHNKHKQRAERLAALPSKVPRGKRLREGVLQTSSFLQLCKPGLELRWSDLSCRLGCPSER